ncbi:TniQ protein [Paenibacillus tianmuensis]|uniref:TniQ protein n=1 Tax=Paenibacillus tianmuensis TaxID=624147 RepID=A0A1G4TKZ8_9BACL|nr:TniQ family protein [Paenibacillus tianmuensis]SCW81927.1 TniQ protein [Paenibacillus tianmuensis]
MNIDYDGFFFEQTDVNERAVSTLYCLKPVGVGTARVEALSSYITRISRMHCVKTGSLLSRIIYPLFDKEYLNNGGGRRFYTSSHLINGVTNISSEFTDILEQLTKRSDLAELTLRKFSNVLPTRGLLKSQKSWCPVCFEEMRQQQTIIYEPLIWMLQPVSVCTKHQVKLHQTCPVCNKYSLILENNSNPGYCSKCLSWLGMKSESQHQDFAGNWEEFKAVSIEKLFSLDLNRLRLTRGNIQWTLGRLVYLYSQDKIAAFAEWVEIPKSTFWGWHSGKNLPTFDDVLRICNKCDLSLVQFYSGIWGLKPNKMVISAKRSKKENVVITQKPIPELGKAFKLLLTDRTNMRFNVTYVAEKLQCNKKTLYKYYGTLCILQAKNSKYYQSNRKALRILKLNGEISKACGEIYGSGQYPSIQKVEKKLGRPAVLRERATREFYQSSLAILLKSGIN